MKDGYCRHFGSKKFSCTGRKLVNNLLVTQIDEVDLVVLHTVY